jgi:hypothetical protein
MIEAQLQQNTDFSLSKAQAACRRSLSTTGDDGTEIARIGLEKEYAQYVAAWETVKVYQKHGDMRQASRIAWAVAGVPRPSKKR